MPKISLVVACARDGTIGRDGAMPWHLPDELRYFRRLTTGQTVLMGRRTFEAIGSRPLPHRRNVVLTRQTTWQAEGVERITHLNALADEAPLMVIGGAEVYRLFYPHAETLYLTRVHTDVAGDAQFDLPDPAHWQLIAGHYHPSDEHHPHAFTMQRWQRRVLHEEMEPSSP